MKLSSFSTIILFLLLAIIGVFLAPQVPLKLNPTKGLPSITVKYNWSGASLDAVEKKVTSKLENVFSTIRGIKNITSRSTQGGGYITISFDKKTDLESTRFEINALIRQVHSKLPEGVSRPSLSIVDPENDEKTLLVYSLSGANSTYKLKKYAEEIIKPDLVLLNGISDIHITGAANKEWLIEYDFQKIQDLGFTFKHVTEAIGTFFIDYPLGMTSELNAENTLNYKHIILTSYDGKKVPWEKIIIGRSGERFVYLTDIAKIKHQESKSKDYFRINGLESVYIMVYSQPDVNDVLLAKSINAKIEKLSCEMPNGYTVLTTYDSTEFITKELQKILYRTLYTVLILLLFVFLLSRQWKYLLIITLSLTANISISFIFFYLFKLEIHLYSLAGITISLGIIIDNSIVMIDHIRHKNNLKVFTAILAATLTTVGALVSIFFLDDLQKVNLVDFAWVIIINVLVSLVLALFLIPALIQKIHFKKKSSKINFNRKRKVVAAGNRYYSFVAKILQYKKSMICIAILLFGLPVFLLPSNISGNGLFSTIYNSTLGNETYNKYIRPYSDIALGGALRPFVLDVRTKESYADPQRTSLNLIARMPHGANIQQLNEVFLDLENFLSGYKEIDQFQVKIHSGQFGTLKVLFKEAYEHGNFPQFLTNKLKQKALYYGGNVESQIFGVGRGYSNKTNGESFNSKIYLYGYNYTELKVYAKKLKEDLLKHPRINEIRINNDPKKKKKAVYSYQIDIDKEMLANRNSHPYFLFKYLQQFALSNYNFRWEIIDGKIEPLKLQSDVSKTFDMWKLENNFIIENEINKFRFKDVASIRKEINQEDITKENEQYKLALEYDFIGTPQHAISVREKAIKDFNNDLPIGFYAKKIEGTAFQLSKEDDKAVSPFWLIFLVIGIIYFICSVLLESLKQPLIIIFMIPLSFIGIFITFSAFQFNFDQGGYASFLLISGITVNSALFILNDFNSDTSKNKNVLQRFLKAFHNKIIPIFLTIISTVLGFIPFIINGQNEVFWFALAVGSIGGLLFSILIILCYLPIFICWKTSLTDLKKRVSKKEKEQFKWKRFVVLVLTTVLITGIALFLQEENTEFREKIYYDIFTPKFRKDSELEFLKKNEIVYKIDIEIADDFDERAVGMMYRKEMKEDKGMLFIFSKPENQGFWMKNTYIPLDLMYIDSNFKIVTIHENTVPLSLKSLSSGVKVKYVLEVNAGFCKRHNIKEGSLIKFKKNE